MLNDNNTKILLEFFFARKLFQIPEEKLRRLVWIYHHFVVILCQTMRFEKMNWHIAQGIPYPAFFDRAFEGVS